MEDKDISLRIAVLSDLHFIDGRKTGTNKSSWLTIDATGQPESALWDDLIDLVSQESLTCDILLCPGDITTYADEIGLKVAWKNLIDLGKKMDVKMVAVATGNHDVQSRPDDTSNKTSSLETATDLFENLKRLSPPYPIYFPKSKPDYENHLNRIHYFGADYLLIDEHEEFRVIVFNSCARHTTEPKEYERGRIAESSLNWIKENLAEIDKIDNKINIFLCHHHPISHKQGHSGQYDFMANGQDLLDALSLTGDWLVIHGHKHQARIVYGTSSHSKAPTIFAAGTLSSHTKISTGFRNQFYIVDIVYTRKRPKKLRGTLSVWNWNQGYRWTEARSFYDGVFSGVGFGEKNIEDIAIKVETILETEIHQEWSDTTKAIPEIRFITPDDLKLLQRYLNEVNIEMLIRDGIIKSVSRRSI